MNTHHTSASHRMLSVKDLIQLLTASRATIWRWTKADQTFPKPFHLSPGRTVWDEAEIRAWIESKKASRQEEA